MYAWDDTTPSGYGTWPFHTKFVKACIDNDVNLLICTQGSTEWASATGATHDPPFGLNDGSEEVHYIDSAEFLAQLVARYGSNKVDASLLETEDKKTGLEYVMYYEDANEPDFWWHEPLWPGDLYGVYLNAVHDGRNLTPNDDYPLLGIKNADPNAVHVMGGLAEYDEDYLNDILSVSNGRLPFDVINFHHYCTDGWGSTRGICPEHKTRGLKPTVDKWQAWRDQRAPGMPIWLTEFGWDTYKSATGASSYIYAGEESQANYLLRSLFLLMGYGIDKGFVFFDKDPNSTGTVQFESSGILTDKNNGLKEKAAFYYLATLQNLVGDYSFVAVDKYAEGDPEVYSYALQSPTQATKYCYVLWCRNGKSKYDDGTTVSDFVFAKPGIKNAVLMQPVDLEEFGEEVEVSLENAGAENSFVTLPSLSEKPRFLFVELNEPLAVEDKNAIISDFRLRIFPNPFNSAISVEYEIQTASDVQISIFDVAGRLVEKINAGRQSAGLHKEQFDFSEGYLSTGVYLVQVRAGERVINQKICHIK